MSTTTAALFAICILVIIFLIYKIISTIFFGKQCKSGYGLNKQGECEQCEYDHYSKNNKCVKCPTDTYSERGSNECLPNALS